MAKIVNVHDAKSQLSRLLKEVQAGEEVIIARAGIPVARLSPVAAEGRQLGFARDQIRIAEDFDAPLPGEQLWYDGQIFPERDG
jgi:prevent-host-death family protein